MTHHTSDLLCPACEEKLEGAHPWIAGWFREAKKRHPELHVCWAWRGEADQEKACAEGKSECHWPDGPHNRMNPLTGKPESKALDVFQIIRGAGVFNRDFYTKLNEENVSQKLPILWGGKFKSLGDFDHFQYEDHLK